MHFSIQTHRANKELVEDVQLSSKMKKKEGKKMEEIPAARRDQGQVYEIRDSALWLWNASEEPVRVGRWER